MFTEQRRDKKAVIYLKRKQAVLEWIIDFFRQNKQSSILQDRNSQDLIALIDDGVILCKLINLFFPNRIEKIIYPKIGSTKYYLRIENINSFIDQCQRLGVPIVFQTLDLFEVKNPARVVNCIHSLIELLDPTNNLKDRIINTRSNKFTQEDLARANLELQIEKEALGKSMSLILYDSINSNSTPTSQQHQFETPSRQDQTSSTSSNILSPSSSLNNLSSASANDSSSGGGNYGTVQYQMTNSNTYESNNLSVLNTSHLRTTIIKTPLSRINNSMMNTSNINYQNTPQIHHTPGFPLMDQMVATSSMMKTASISTAPIKTSPSPLHHNINNNNNNNDRFLTNSVYNNRYLNTNTNINTNITNNNNNINDLYTPYRPSNDLKISDLNQTTQKTSTTNTTVNNNTTTLRNQKQQIQQQQQQIQKQQQLNAQQHQILLNKQKEEQELRNKLQQLNQQQQQQQQQFQIDQIQQQNIKKPNSPFKDILIFLILLISIYIWINLFYKNDNKFKSVLVLNQNQNNTTN